MRGRILQYNGSDGTGIVVADGQQYKFGIGVWKSATAPVVGKTVELVLDGTTVQAVTLVGDDVLLREKTAELTGKLGELVSKSGASGVGGSVLARYGRVILVAYVLFLIGTLMLNAISMEMFGMKQGKPMFDLAAQLSQAGGGGGVKALLLLAYLSIGVPLVWPDKRAWLALLMPLLAVLWGLWQIHNSVGPMAELFSYGIGFYLSVAAAVVLAGSGVRRFLVAA
jgi:hypothetical protein